MGLSVTSTLGGAEGVAGYSDSLGSTDTKLVLSLLGVAEAEGDFVGLLDVVDTCDGVGAEALSIAQADNPKSSTATNGILLRIILPSYWLVKANGNLHFHKAVVP